MKKHRCSLFVETGPADEDGWVPGLSIRVEVGTGVDVLIYHARRYVSEDRLLQVLSHDGPARVENIDPSVSLELVRNASSALRRDGVDVDAAAVLAAAE